VSNAIFAADIHSLGVHSVDAREIRWGGTNKYSTNRSAAIAAWNALGKVSIVPDDFWHIEDPTFYDAYNPNMLIAGQWIHIGLGSDTITVNNYWLDMYSPADRTCVFAHELGHALGIGDHESGNYANTLMYYRVSGITAPQAHDQADYFALWP